MIGEELPDPMMLPGLEVTQKLTIGLPPSLAGALKVIVACPLPALAATPAGAPGTVCEYALVIDDICANTNTDKNARIALVLGKWAVIIDIIIPNF
jgi:hypothetical protein